MPKEIEMQQMKSRHDILKEKVMANVKLIQSVFPEYSVTDAQIEECISEKRIKQHENAKAVQEKDAKMTAFTKSGGVKPPSFERCTPQLLDWSGTPEAEKYNEKCNRLIGQTTDEGHEFRKELMAKIWNKVQALDSDRVINGSFDDRFEYAMEHPQDVYLGFEMGHILGFMGDMGLDVPAEEKDNLEKLKLKGQDIGGVGNAVIQAAASEYFLTMPPLDSLTMEQKMMLTPLVGDKLQPENVLPSKDPQDTPQKRASSFVGNWDTSVRKIKDYEEPEPRNYKKDGFVELPEKKEAFYKRVHRLERKIARGIQQETADKELSKSVKEKTKGFKDLFKDLKNADAWYNWNNSGEYKNMLTALQEAGGTLSQLGEPLGEEQRKAAREAMEKVSQMAEKYIAHVGDTPKNARQAKRLELVQKALAEAKALNDGIQGYDKGAQDRAAEEAADKAEQKREAEINKAKRNAAQAKAAPAKKEPIKEEPIKGEPVKEEPVKKEPVKEEPVKEEPAKEKTPRAQMMEKAQKAVEKLQKMGIEAKGFNDKYRRETNADLREKDRPSRMDTMTRQQPGFYAAAIKVAQRIANGEMGPSAEVSNMTLYNIMGGEALKSFYLSGDDTMEKYMEKGLGSRGVIPTLDSVPEIKEKYNKLTAQQFVDRVCDPDFMKFSPETMGKIKEAAPKVMEVMAKHNVLAPTHKNSAASIETRKQMSTTKKNDGMTM